MPQHPRCAAQGAEERVAIVFGDERSGMSNLDLSRCHQLSAISTGDEQPSLNLAQAVLVYCYELRLAWLATSERRSSAPLPAAATTLELATLEESFKRALRHEL